MLHRCLQGQEALVVVGQEALVVVGSGAGGPTPIVCACVDCVHTCDIDLRLGELERERVKELDLPSFAAEVVPGGEGHSVGEPRRPDVGERKGPEQECRPFILSEALPVLPAKLVRRILRGEYIDMAELLKDNMEVERRRALSEAEEGRARVNRREVPDLLSWLQCFSLYAAVVGSRFPDKVQDLWAYQATIIAEHRRCGGRGWRLYDAGFRQQITSLEAAEFGKLNQALYATTFLAYGSVGQFCGSCLQTDHSLEDCALNPNRAVPVVRLREPPREHREPSREHRDGGRTGEAGFKRRRRIGACYAWNDGRCNSPSCRFEHVCSRCHGEHKRLVCSGGEFAKESGSARERAGV